MAATFAHIIIDESLCKEAESLPNIMPTVQMAVENYGCFCKLGAVSPDLPYGVGSTGATGYANLMHYLRTADFVRCGLQRVLEMKFSLAETRACIAWVFGYAAHIVTDLTIHPVISRKFGDYAKSAANRKQHHFCELNQDVYLFKKLYAKEILDTDFLEFSRLGDCAVRGRLSPAIEKLWRFCLDQYPRSETREYVRLPSQSLLPNVWYKTYLNELENIVAKGHFKKEALGCPRSADINPVYIQDLPTASGGTIGYDELFRAAVQNVRTTWGTMAAALAADDVALFTLPNANLDTGLADATQAPVFVV